MVNKTHRWLVAQISLLLLSSFILIGESSSLYADEVVEFANDEKVVAQLDSSSIFENQPITGTVMITHDINNKVDKNSFRLDKEPLTVALVKEVQFDPTNPLILSIYSFQIPGKPPGLYALPAISVRVGSKTYQSIMVSYAVQTGKNPAATAPSTPTSAPGTPSPAETPPSPKASAPPFPHSPGALTSASNEPSLRLEALIDGKNSIYPGQRTTLTYRYYYSGHIELTAEKLPLLDAQGMTKIGEKDIKDSAQGELSVSQISQEVEAVNPGDFVYGPSEVEGYAYNEDASGKHIHTSPKLTSVAPPVTVTVLPFPEKMQPASFNGAIGKYQFKVILKSSPEINVGDDITLNVDITGEGNIQNVPLPNISLQPGFNGFFHFNDLPPQEEVHDHTKTFIVQLRPLADDIKEIPSIEFSSFNPETAGYTILQSHAIPIKIKATTSPVKSQASEPAAPEKLPKTPPSSSGTLSHPSSMQSYLPALIEVQRIIVLVPSDLYNRLSGTWWALGLVPLGIGLIIYQLYARNYILLEEKQAKIPTSHSVLRQALQQPEGSPGYFDGLSRSLKMALVETGQLSTVDIADEKLPDKGMCGEVRAFLCDIEEKRFAGRNHAGKDILDYASVQVMVNALMGKIHRKGNSTLAKRGLK